MNGANSTRFVTSFSDEGCWIQLIDVEEIIPPSTWTSVATPRELLEASHLLSLSRDGRATEGADGVFLPNATIATLGDAQVRALNLPEPVPFILEIRSKGTLRDQSFSFETRWYRQDGRSIAVAPVRGVELSALGNRYIVLDPVFTILRRLREFNDSPPTTLDERMAFWGELRALFYGAGAPEIKADRYLDNLRVYRATRFTLNVETRPDGSIDFDPVLMSVPQAARPSSDDVIEPEILEAPALLPADLTPTFSRRFRSADEVRSQYAVDGGVYVVFSEEARVALSAVRRAQQGTPAERKAFARSPQAHIREALEVGGFSVAPSTEQSGRQLDEIVEDLFTETQQFSERVREIGLWQKPTLPWLAAKAHGWLPPEVIPVTIEGQEYAVHLDELPELVDEMGQAVAVGQESVPYRDQDIPATDEAHSVLAAAQDAATAESAAWLAEESRREGVTKPSGPYSFKGGANDNFETEGYIAKQEARRHGGLELPLLASTLIPHQEVGVAWLQGRWEAGFKGALLADDMGLGKSYQCLAFLSWLKQQMRNGSQPSRPILVVAPTGLIPNWLNEHRRHLRAPGLGRAFVATGDNLKMYRHPDRSKDVNAGAPALRVDELRECEWIITTYETLRDYQYSFGLIPFAAAVFDEAQKIKNPGALVTNVAKHMNVDFFIASTGTPVENRLADLWSITDMIQPGYLGPLRAFSSRYEDETVPYEERLTRIAGLRGMLEAIPGRKPPGMMTRRMKDATLRGLPEKHEHIIARAMPSEQANRYALAIADGRKKLRGPSDKLHAIQALRGLSLHHIQPGSIEDTDYIASSARLAALFDTLDDVRSRGDKALVFLESLEMQKYLAALIMRRYRLDDLPMIISGEVSASKRQERVERFQGDDRFDVMILSPKAGGVGITLTKANHVIHLSRWWNPAVEDQCTDRVYRIGQEKPVHVYYLQAVHPEYGEHSFDIKLHNLLEKKRALSRDLLLPSSFSDGDTSELFDGTVTSVSNDEFGS